MVEIRVGIENKYVSTEGYGSIYTEVEKTTVTLKHEKHLKETPDHVAAIPT